MAKTGTRNSQIMAILGRSYSHEKSILQGINPMEKA
jgi:hypothetical protein